MSPDIAPEGRRRVARAARSWKRIAIGTKAPAGRHPLRGNVAMPTTYTNLLYHIVFSTKQRIPLIADEWKEESYQEELLALLESHGVEYDPKCP